MSPHLHHFWGPHLCFCFGFWLGLCLGFCLGFGFRFLRLRLWEWLLQFQESLPHQNGDWRLYHHGWSLSVNICHTHPVMWCSLSSGILGYQLTHRCVEWWTMVLDNEGLTRMLRTLGCFASLRLDRGWESGWYSMQAIYSCLWQFLCMHLRSSPEGTTDSLVIIPGWWLGHPSEKYESQLGWLFPIYGKSNSWQPNHQPDTCLVHINTYH